MHECSLKVNIIKPTRFLALRVETYFLKTFGCFAKYGLVGRTICQSNEHAFFHILYTVKTFFRMM